MHRKSSETVFFYAEEEDMGSEKMIKRIKIFPTFFEGTQNIVEGTPNEVLTQIKGIIGKKNKETANMSFDAFRKLVADAHGLPNNDSLGIIKVLAGKWDGINHCVKIQEIEYEDGTITDGS